MFNNYYGHLNSNKTVYYYLPVIRTAPLRILLDGVLIGAGVQVACRFYEFFFYVLNTLSPFGPFLYMQLLDNILPKNLTRHHISVFRLDLL